MSLGIEEAFYSAKYVEVVSPFAIDLPSTNTSLPNKYKAIL